MSGGWPGWIAGGPPGTGCADGRRTGQNKAIFCQRSSRNEMWAAAVIFILWDIYSNLKKASAMSRSPQSHDRSRELRLARRFPRQLPRRTEAVFRPSERRVISGREKAVIPAPKPAAALSRDRESPKNNASEGERTEISSSLAAAGSA